MNNPDKTKSNAEKIETTTAPDEIEMIDLGDAMVETKQPYPGGPFVDSAFAYGWGV